MKSFVFICIISSAFSHLTSNDSRSAEDYLKNNNISIHNIHYNAVVKFMAGMLFDVVKTFPTSLNDTSISLNQYIDDGLENFRGSFQNPKYNRLELADAHIELSPVGHMDLSNGFLKDFATVNRTGDVHLTYNQTEKKARLILPFTFKKLKFSYRYNTKVTLLNVRGRIFGMVTDPSFYIESVYDFVTHKLILDHLDIKHLGDLTIRFSGHRMMDWMINSMTRTAGGVLQPLIINEVTQNLKQSLTKFLDDLNREIAKRFYDYHD